MPEECDVAWRYVDKEDLRQYYKYMALHEELRHRINRLQATTQKDTADLDHDYEELRTTWAKVLQLKKRMDAQRSPGGSSGAAAHEAGSVWRLFEGARQLVCPTALTPAPL